MLHTSGRSKEGEVAWRDSLAILRKLADDFPAVPEYQQRVAGTLTALATLFRATDRPADAEAAYREALAIGKRLVADFPQRPDFREGLALSHNNLGFLLYRIGRLDQANQAYADALTLWKQLATEYPQLPKPRQELARTYYNIGLLQSDAKRPAEAEAAFKDAHALLKQLASESPKVPDYQISAAGTLTKLGSLLHKTGRPLQAETAYGDALVFRKQLAADFPGAAGYQNELAGTLVTLANFKRLRREFTGAMQLLEQARPHHLAALEAEPKNPGYRQSYRHNLQVLAECLVGLANHAQLATTAEELARLCYDPAADAYSGASYLCQCITLADKDRQPADAQRKESAQNYANRALALLRQAIVRGYKDAASMKKDPNLEPLRARGDFKKLLADLEEQSKK
jgi:tetratricopeptide (TPR) repeat protein